MKLPQELQRFSEPTLIVATDGQMARLYLAGGDSLESLDHVAHPPEKPTDAEDVYGGDVHDTPRKEQFAAEVAERIASIIHQGHAVHIRLASLPEMLHRIDDRLPPDVKERVVSRTAHDLLTESEVDLVKRVLGD